MRIWRSSFAPFEVAALKLTGAQAVDVLELYRVALAGYPNLTIRVPVENIRLNRLCADCAHNRVFEYSDDLGGQERCGKHKVALGKVSTGVGRIGCDEWRPKVDTAALFPKKWAEARMAEMLTEMANAENERRLS